MKRIGTFEVADELKGEPVFVAFLERMNVIETRQSFSRHDCTDYLAEFAEFDEVQPGEIIPQYRFVFTRHVNGNVTHETQRI